VFLHSETQLGAFALVGMGALFAAVIRAPITSVLIIFEMTGNYNLVLPLMIANSVSYVIARKLYPTPIYEALLEQDNIHLPQAGRAATGLAAFHVSDAMTMEVVALPADESIETAAQRIAGLPYSVYPIVEQDGRLLGLISDSRVRRRLASGEGSSRLREQARPRESLRADQPLVAAVLRMHRLGARQMAVVSDDDNHLCGMLAMSDVMRAHVAAADAAGRPDPDGDDWTPRQAVAWPARDTAGYRASEAADSDRPPPAPRRT
jgi:CIC family chloride channel protein